MWAPALLRDVKGVYNGPCPPGPSDSPQAEAAFNSEFGVGGNHEVALVGYNARGGIANNGTYIKIKNSWGGAVASCLDAKSVCVQPREEAGTDSGAPRKPRLPEWAPQGVPCTAGFLAVLPL
jgi:hypothetical protein